MAAFVAILLGGGAGGLIGHTLVDLQCHGSCATPKGIGTLIGSVVAALGMSVVAILVLAGAWVVPERERRARRAQADGSTAD